MSEVFEHIMGTVKNLSASERAELAHYLIGSLEQPENGVDQAWKEVIDTRWSQIESGTVQTLSWEEIKKRIRA
jgi:putative addiction module component (TIGR02574 family)